MESSLRPLTLGEILDRTAQLYRNNFLLFAGIFAVYAGVLLVLGMAQIGLMELLKAQHQHIAGMLPWTLAFSMLVVVPVMVLALGVSTAATSRAVAWVHLGEPATIRGAYRSILPRLGRYLWLMIVIVFRVWAPFAVLYAAFFGVAYRAGLFAHMGVGPGAVAQPAFAHHPQAAIAFFGEMAILGLLMLPAGIYAILMSLRYSLAIPASVLENLKAGLAIRRSIALAKGSWGRIFLLALLVGALKLVLVGLAQSFIFVLAIKHPGQLPGPGVSSISQVIAFFTNSFLGPIWAMGITLFYYDQRVRKEGYDIEWMMQAAGLTPPAPQLSAEPIAAGTGAEPSQAFGTHAKPLSAAGQEPDPYPWNRHD